MSTTLSPQAVLHFWAHATTPEQWFTKDPQFDQRITQQFLHTTEAVAQGECAHWRHSLHGRLAEIIVLDQFSRNIWRDTPRAFAQDPMALALAQETLRQPQFAQLSQRERQFILMPFMHSESKKIHVQALELFKKYTDDITIDYEVRHKVIIDQFGRYPHRNAILGRLSTAAELEFLKGPNSSF